MDSRLVRDIRVLISAPRRIELAGAVDAEQAVVAGLVQVNDPRCPLDVVSASDTSPCRDPTPAPYNNTPRNSVPYGRSAPQSALPALPLIIRYTLISSSLSH